MGCCKLAAAAAAVGLSSSDGDDGRMVWGWWCSENCSLWDCVEKCGGKGKEYVRQQK